MRKYLLIFSFLPLVGFCNDVEFSYKAYAYNTSGKLLVSASFKGTDFFNAKFDTVFSLILNQSWVPLSFNTLTLRLSHPSFSSPFTNSVQNSAFPFLGSNGLAYSFGYFPETANIFVTIIHLYNNGYRNDNFIKTFVDNGFNKPSTCNVSPLNIYLDVLQGTNTLYRQIVLNSLKELNQNLLSIDDNLFNFVDMYRSINSSKLGDYSSLSNTIIGLEQQYLLPRNFNGLLQDLDSSYWDLTNDEGKLAYSERQKQIAESLPFINSFMNLIKSQEHFNQDFDNPLNDFLKNAGDKINNSSNQKLNDLIDIQSSIDGSVQDIRRLTTNWVDDVKRELGTLNVSTSNHNSKVEKVIKNNAVQIVGQNGGAVAIAGGVTIENQNPLSVHLDGPISIDNNQFGGLRSDLDLIEQSIIEFKSLFSDFYKDNEENSWFKFLEDIRAWRINEIADNVSNQLDVAWEIHSGVTNILNAITNDNQYLLLSDYKDYIDDGNYDNQISLARSFVSDCLQYGEADYSEMLDSLGVGSGSGNWWQFITGSLSLMGNLSVTNYYMISYVFSNLVATVNYANDQFEGGGFLGQASKVIDSFPNEEYFYSNLDNITNTINDAVADFQSVYDQLGSTTNQFSTTIKQYYKASVLPANVQLQLLPGILPFQIPVGEHREIFDLLRMSMAFAISIINLVLLPKFILKIFTLFFGVVDSQIKISAMDQSNT